MYCVQTDNIPLAIFLVSDVGFTQTVEKITMTSQAVALRVLEIVREMLLFLPLEGLFADNVGVKNLHRLERKD